MNAPHAPQPGSGETPGQEARLASSMGTLDALRIDQEGPSAGSPVGEPVSARVLGLDLGAESIKLVELSLIAGEWRWTRRLHLEHGKQPGPRLVEALAEFDWPTLTSAAVSGRLSRLVRLPRVPTKQAQARAYRFLFGDAPATIVSIGSHGFSVLELREKGIEVFRENSRCSQGTGNFLRQLIERFGLEVEAASELCADVPNPAPLSGRCPVILKTDMTHLANKGESQARILAGLFDAVGANVTDLAQAAAQPEPGGADRRGQPLAPGPAESGEVPRGQRPPCPDRRARGCAVLRGARQRAGGGRTADASSRPVRCCPPRGPKPNSSVCRRSPSRCRGCRRMAPPPAPSLERSRPAVGPWIRHRFDRLEGGGAGRRSRREAVWDGYRPTGGDPVGAAQALLRAFVGGPAGRFPSARWR